MLWHMLEHLENVERLMTEANAEQTHLDTDVQSLTAAIAQEVAELKAQAAAAGAALDFTKLDALVASTQADATADAPPAPAPAPAPEPAPAPAPEPAPAPSANAPTDPGATPPAPTA